MDIDLDLDFFDTTNIEYEHTTKSSSSVPFSTESESETETKGWDTIRKEVKKKKRKSHKKKKKKIVEETFEESEEKKVEYINKKYPDLYDLLNNRSSYKKEFPCEQKTINSLQYLQQGTSLYKYCISSGDIHWRYFQISPDTKKLVWFSNKKKFKNTQIFISDIINIDDGLINDLDLYNRELSELGFTIYYNMPISNTYKTVSTLTLICKSYKELQIWKHGLRNLIIKGISKENTLDIDILLKCQDKGFKKYIENFDNDHKYSEKLNKYKKSFHDLKKKLYCRSYEYISTLNTSFTTIHNDLDYLKKCIDKYNYVECAKIVWLLEIELNTLKIRVKVLGN